LKRLSVVVKQPMDFQSIVVEFDYDLPDQAGLRIVRDVKCKYPSNPFIMLTEDHLKRLTGCQARCQSKHE